MIINDKIEIIGNSRNIKYFTEMGYDIEVGKKITVNVKDLSNGSTFKVLVACDICNTEKSVIWSSYYKCVTSYSDKKYYCQKCSIIKRKETNQERYGGNSPVNSKEVIDKIKKTNQERYGNNSTLHGNRQQIIEDIFIEKYGEKTPLLNKEVINKSKESMIKKWGVDTPLRSSEIKDKIKLTNLNKWGFENPSSSDLIKNKIKEINLDKWGVEFYYQSKDFLEKKTKTIVEKYGVSEYFKSTHRNKYVLNNKIYNYSNLKIIGYNHRIFTIECDVCDESYEISTDLLYKRNKENRIICTKCNSINNYFRSSAELEICRFLEENKINFEYSKRDLIKGEIDIYLPDYKIAIEYNGIFWHSEFFKNKKYHYDKYNNCKILGINLIQIWEDQWLDDKDKVKSFILNKLKIYSNRILARNCKVRKVNNNDKDQFLNNNHLQKTSKSSINLGLYHNDELVSIMTFGKRRLNSKDTFELIRYCCKKGSIIIGGASKLFSFFKKNNNFSEIISYSDNTVSDGDIYRFLNFKETNESINYYWCDGRNRYHRFTFNKKRLIKDGHDKNKTEYQIMREIGYYRIFGAGIKTWSFKKDN